MTRLGALFGGPVLLCALAGRRPAWLLAVLSLPLAYWQLHPPVRDTAQAAGDASTGAAYYRPLIAALRRAGGPPGRVEIPPLREHGEARFVAPAFPLARGWERQLDTKYAPLFYESGLTAARYRAWLDDNAVRWVAVADAPLDGAAKREAALVRGGLPYLREVWRDRHWRLYAVTRPRPLAAVPLTRPEDGPRLGDAARDRGRERHRPRAPVALLGGGPGRGLRRPRGRLDAR